MARFNNPSLSHQHSRAVMDLIVEHDDFLDSVTTVADFGCGAGFDIQWWANLHDREDPPKPRNFLCYAVDNNDQAWGVDPHDRITFIKGDFENKLLSRKVDILWCHDAFQYATDPLNTLRVFNQQMDVNGMLYICIPMMINSFNNRWKMEGRSFELYNHTPLSMIYMLGLSGFDTRNAYMFKGPSDPWLHIAIHKNDERFFDPKVMGWHDLANEGLLHDSVMESISRNGYPIHSEIVYPWLDHENHFFSA